jgi:hypothetical protein
MIYFYTLFFKWVFFVCFISISIFIFVDADSAFGTKVWSFAF